MLFRSGTMIGEPLTGHTHTVSAVATLVLPDGRPVAVTSSRDTTMRVWDLEAHKPLGYPLHVASAVSSLAGWSLGSRVGVVVAGPGLLFARVDVEVDRL